jgi:hypothetical protein
MNPVGDITRNDWVSVFTFADGSTKRFGSSPNMTENKVTAMCMGLIPEDRRKHVVDIQVCRRSDLRLQPNKDMLRA